MNFFKRNAVFLGILGGFVILLAGSVLLLMQKIRERATVEEELNQKIEERSQLWKKNPFPKNENVILLQKHTDEEKALVEDSLKLLRREPIVTKRISGSECKDVIFSVRRAMAGMLTQNSVKFPDKFHFGFDRYDIRPPEEDDTPMIQKQLKVVEELVRVIAAAHFTELVSIKRVEFEKFRDNPVQNGMPIPVQSVARSATSPTTDPLIPLEDRFEIVDNPSYIYAIMPFEVKLIGDTEALRGFLNGLARAPQIFLPRYLRLENEKKEPLSKESAKSLLADRTMPGLPRPPGSPEVKPENLRIDPEEAPYVLGEEKIVVNLRIDWVEFREAQRSSKDKK